MSKYSKILLVGFHPLRQSVIAQYKNDGCEVTCLQNIDNECDINAFDELCVMPGFEMEPEPTDNKSIQLLQQLASQYDISRHDGRKMRCHLLLHSNATLRLVRTIGFEKNVEQCFEIYAFTTEDQWAKQVLCGLGVTKYDYPRLDRQSISYDSEKTVRLVINGLTEIAECLAIHAALVAHYPNYNRNTRLRTRITLIDKEIDDKTDAFISRYQHLFENSYYRIVRFVEGKPSLQKHAPMYEGRRKDFVDVEWEFVVADIHNATVRQKLITWSTNEDIELTLALCDDDATNINDALDLPDAVFEHEIPTLLYAKDDSVIHLADGDKRFGNIRPFGMTDSGYDVTLPLMQMAKMLNYFYSCGNDIPLAMPADKVEEAWRNVSSVANRYSSMYNVMTIPTKMHTIGHDGKDWNEYYALTQKEIELISEVEHNRWSIERLIVGWRPCTDDERREIHDNLVAIVEAKKNGSPLPDDLKKFYKNNRRVHYDLVAYDELDIDASGVNVKYFDYSLTASIPLIAKSFIDKSNCHD